MSDKSVLRIFFLGVISILVACGDGAKPQTESLLAADDIEISSSNGLWLAPNDTTKITATPKAAGASIKWERISENGQPQQVSDKNEYEYKAGASLSKPCATIEEKLRVTAFSVAGEKTRDVSIRVQNKICTLKKVDGLTSDVATKVLVAKDANRSVYVGTDSGLTRFRNTIATGFAKSGGGRDLAIITAIGDADGEIWVAIGKSFPPYPIRGFGIERLDPKNGDIWKQQQILPNSYIADIHFGTDEKGVSFPLLATAENFLSSGGAPGGVVRGNLAFDASGDVLPKESIYVILPLERDLWFFGGDKGIFGYRQNTQIARFDGRQWNGNSGFLGLGSNRAVRAMAKDSAGAIWIGLQGGKFQAGGIVRFVPNASFDAGTWTVTANNPGGNDIRAMAVDANGDLWIATDKGLVRRKADGASFKLYTAKDDALASDDIRDIFYDATTRYLWLATAAGVTRISEPQFP